MAKINDRVPKGRLGTSRLYDVFLKIYPYDPTSKCVVPENIHTPPHLPHGRSLEIPKRKRGGGGSEAKISEVSGSSSLAFFPEGGKEFLTNE